ncbi:MAG: glycine radical domain-containing protein [Acetomicrobium sp.]
MQRPAAERQVFRYRKAFHPSKEAAEKGIAAVFGSVSKCDWDKTGGALLNQKLSPDLLEGEENVKKLAQAIRTFFMMGGHHVQFNVVSTELLKEAQKKA